MGPETRAVSTPAEAFSVFDLECEARKRMTPEGCQYLAGGADDGWTMQANRDAFRAVQIRPRRLVDVRQIDTSRELLGIRLPSPILLAPVALQQLFHHDAELASARASAARGQQMIVSSLSYHSVDEIAPEASPPVWFQLYPTPDRAITTELLRRAERAGCPVVALTADTPVLGNREGHNEIFERQLAGKLRLGNFEGLGPFESITDPGMTWEMVGWLKRQTSMQVLVKGVVTAEDAVLCVEHGADGIIVSNHGGRQLDGGRGTLACLPEVVDAVAGRIPVLIDGGVRRGTDVLKALALGADAVCIGRAYCWGLGAFGEPGVARALELLHEELVRAMQLAGTPSLAHIERRYCT